MSCVERELFWDEVSSFCVLEKSASDVENFNFIMTCCNGDTEIARYIGLFFLYFQNALL